MCTSNKQNEPDHLAALKDRIRRVVCRLDEHFLLKAKLDEGLQWAKANPQTAVVIGVTALVCSLPVLGFAAFVLITLLFGLMGFVVVEGFIVSIGAMILLGILAVLASMSVAASGLGVLAWVLFKHGRNALQQVFSHLSQDDRQGVGTNGIDHVGPREKPVDKEA